MSMNRVAETISEASSGTGNLTLTGAWNQAGTINGGNETFFDALGINHVFRYTIRDLNNNWEDGEGYLSDATTLVRLTVFRNSLKTTAKINFSTGFKVLMIATTALAFGSRMLNNVNYSLTSQSVGVRGEITMVANRLYVTPHLLLTPQKASTIAHTITQGAASSQMRVGIYNLVKQTGGNNYDSAFMLFKDLGLVDVTSAGVKSITTDFNLQQGVYGIGVISNGAPRIMAGGTNLLDLGLSPNTYQFNPISHWYNDGASQFTALPAMTFGAMAAIMNAGGPQAMFRGGII